MPQHYFPDRRIPYDEDGSRVFVRRIIQTQAIPPVVNNERDWTEISEIGRNYLNSSRRYSLSNGQIGAGILQGAMPHYGAWSLAVIFPRPMDLSGFYFSSAGFPYFTTFNDYNSPALPALQVSSDTTALDDGVWSDPVTLEAYGTTFYFTNTVDVFFFPTAERQRYRVYDESLDAETWLQKGMDVLGSYREQTPDNGPGIVPLYGPEFKNVKAIRFVPVNMNAVTSSSYVALGNRLNLHLYGSPSPDLGDWGVDIVNADGSLLDANDLVLGNLLQGPEDAPANTVQTPAFRVRNYSVSQTAEDVVIRVHEDPEQRWATDVTGYETKDRMTYTEARLNGGSWVGPTDGVIELSLGDLAPGATSGTVEIRLSSIALSFLSFDDLFYGPGNIRATPVVGAWS